MAGILKNPYLIPIPLCHKNPHLQIRQQCHHHGYINNFEPEDNLGYILQLLPCILEPLGTEIRCHDLNKELLLEAA